MPKESEHKELETQLDNLPTEDDEETFVEIEGKKFKEDPDNPGESLKDENDEPIPFEEKNEETFVEIDGKKFKEDPENPGEALLDDDEEPIPFEEKGEEEFKMPDKFKGKSVEEIAKSYGELEKMIEKKAKEKAEEIIKKKEKGEGEEEEEEEKEEIKPPMKEGKIDFASMTPDTFAEWIIQEIEKRAEAKARKIFDEGSKVKESVSAEISAAQVNHPLLKTSEEYRELVLAIIEAAASKGKVVSLEDACKKVETLVGKKEGTVEEKEKAKLKKAKAAVEKGGGAPGGEKPDTEEEKLKKSLLGETKSQLGGLGI